MLSNTVRNPGINDCFKVQCVSDLQAHQIKNEHLSLHHLLNTRRSPERCLGKSVSELHVSVQKHITTNEMGSTLFMRNRQSSEKCLEANQTCKF